MKTQAGFSFRWGCEQLGFCTNHVTNSLDFFYPMGFGLAASTDYDVLINSRTDSCYFCVDVKLSRYLVLITDCESCLMVWDFCCFHKLSSRGFAAQGNCALIWVRCSDSTGPGWKDFCVQKVIDGFESFGIWLCGFLEGKCGRDCWGRSTYVICCVAAHSLPLRCYRSSSMLC